MNESLDVVHSTRFQKDMRSNHIVVREGHAVAERVVYPSFSSLLLTHVTLSSEVHDSVNVLRLQHIGHETRTEDVALFFTLGNEHSPQ